MCTFSLPRFAEKLNVTSSVPDLYNHKHVCNATATRLKGVLAPKMMSMLVAAPIVTDNNKSDDMTLTEYKGEWMTIQYGSPRSRNRGLRRTSVRRLEKTKQNKRNAAGRIDPKPWEAASRLLEVVSPQFTPQVRSRRCPIRWGARMS